MKKTGNLAITIILIAVVGFIIWENIDFSKKSATVSTDEPFVTTIEQKRFVPGNLYPLTEIDIKSQISGTLEKVFVKIGDKVKIGDNIAQVKLIPDPSNLERAKSNFNAAKINYENEIKVFNRNKKLYNEKVIPQVEYDEHKRVFEVSKQQYLSAQNQLTLILDGTIRDADISNIIKATATGNNYRFTIKKRLFSYRTQHF